jgi:sn-glycerol 3-phosphate transport system substrate-binding protein
MTIESGYECPRGEPPGPDEPVDVTFWHVQTGTGGEVIDALAAEYDAAHPEVRITSLYQDPQVAFIPAVTSGELPDLISAVNANFMQLAIDSDVILPMGACLAADDVDVSDFLPRTLGATTKEGELWALPFFVTELMLYYNPLAFEAAGLDPARAPTTLDEVHEMSKQIVASGYTRQGVSFAVSSAVLQTLFSKSAQPFVDQDNGRSGRATQLTISDDVGLQAFTTLQEMVADGTASTVTDRFDALLAIGNKDAAMAIGALSYDLQNIIEAFGAQDFPGVELGIAPMPSLTSTPRGAADVRGESLFLTDGADPAVVDAAYRFALWLTEPAQQARLHVEANSLPVRASSADEPPVVQYWKTQPLARVAFDDLTLPEAPPGGGGAIHGQALQVNDLVTQAWMAASAPGADAAAILDRLVTDANAAIAEYNALAEVDG